MSQFVELPTAQLLQMSVISSPGGDSLVKCVCVCVCVCVGTGMTRHGVRHENKH
jgi:hypothetical protein